MDYQILFFNFDYPDSSIFVFDQVFALENNPFGVAYNAGNGNICDNLQFMDRPVNYDSNVLCLEDLNRIG